MKKKVDNALHTIADTIFSWPCVDSILSLEHGDDQLDPYFMISLDVYYRGEIPPETLRLPAFSYAGAFESNLARLKDRFLFEDIPFRVEYKSADRFDELLGGKSDMRDNLSYALYRVQKGRVLHARSAWIREAKLRLVTMEESFWSRLRHFQEGRLQHCLNDLKAAVIKEDPLFFNLSLAGYLESLAGILFAANHEFQPPPRYVMTSLRRLSSLPDGILVLLDSLLCRDEVSPARMAELASKCAVKVLAL